MPTLVKNLAALMASRGDVQDNVAERGGISQRAVGYVLTYGKSHETVPTLRTIEGLARAYDLPPWLLLVPGLDVDALATGELPKLIASFLSSGHAGRENIARVAENEVRYNALQKPLFSRSGNG